MRVRIITVPVQGSGTRPGSWHLEWKRLFMSKVIDSSTTRLKRLELSARIALAMDHLLPNHISSTGAIYRPRLPTNVDSN